MNYFADALAWIVDPAHLHGSNGILARSAEHLWYTLLAVALACLVAIPAGWYVGHTGRGRSFAVGLSGAVRAVPTLGLITLFGILLGIGLTGPMLAFVVLAIPSILAGAYAGVEAIDPAVLDAARASGMTEWQVLRQVEIPLGLPLTVAGVRSAALQVVATATLAAYVGAGGLGRYLFLGLKTQDYAQMLAGSLLVVALALISEAVFSTVQRFTTPAGLRTL